MDRSKSKNEYNIPSLSVLGTPYLEGCAAADLRRPPQHRDTNTNTYNINTMDTMSMWHEHELNIVRRRRNNSE